MFITIGDYCYNTDQIKYFGLSTMSKEEFVSIELVNGEKHTISFEGHENALESFHHALKQLCLMTCNQAKKEKDLNSHDGVIEFLRR